MGQNLQLARSRSINYLIVATTYSATTTSLLVARLSQLGANYALNQRHDNIIGWRLILASMRVNDHCS